jgi:signal transduction histidine kinase
LVTTITLGVGLAATGISGYVQAHRSAQILDRSQVMAIGNGLRREISRSRGDVKAAVEAYMADDGNEGLGYVAFLDRQGRTRARYGRARMEFDPLLLETVKRGRFGMRGPRRGEPVVRRTGTDVVHALLPLPKRLGRRGLFKEAPGPVFIAIEAESKEGRGIVSNALMALIIELGAGVVLLGGALLFWRQSQVAERNARIVADERREMALSREKDERLKALGRMSAVLGHELKNPIAALKGHAQLLLEKIDRNHPCHRQAVTVVREAELLETLTSQVLAFVRTGELTFSKVYLDDLAYSAAQLSGVENVDVTAPEEVTWRLDRQRMEQALVNLLVNARQASPPDAPIDLVFVADERTLSITVRDRGPGIDPVDRERIFQPFYTGRTQGTGLGLALVKRIVEGHGGTVSVERHAEGGALFSIVLPKVKVPEEVRGEDE